MVAEVIARCLKRLYSFIRCFHIDQWSGPIDQPVSPLTDVNKWAYGDRPFICQWDGTFIIILFHLGKFNKLSYLLLVTL